MIDLNVLKTNKSLGIGCSTFGGSSSKKVARRVLDHAYESGIIYFDVARSYGYGQAEGVVGKFAKDKRESIVIATKFGILPPRDIPFKGLLISAVRQARKFIPRSNNSIRELSGKALSNHSFTPGLAVKSLEKSLKELKTDYVDIFLFHESKFSDMLLDDVINSLEKEMEKGKLRMYGGTFHDRNDLTKALQRPDRAQVVQFPFGLDLDFQESASNAFCVKVIYSILNYSKPWSSDNDMILRQVKEEFPELDFLRTLSELMLLIAAAELSSGVLLSSTTNTNHIDRNQVVVGKTSLDGARLVALKALVSTLFEL